MCKARNLFQRRVPLKRCSTLEGTLLANIRLGLKGLPSTKALVYFTEYFARTNDLAYLAGMEMTEKKKVC